MPLSIVLLALVASGAAAGLVVPASAWRLLALLGASLALTAWLARRSGFRGVAVLCAAGTLVAGMALRTVLALQGAERPPLVAFFAAHGGTDSAPVGRDV